MADGGTFADAAPLGGLSLAHPPSNLQAEMSLLGAILANNRAFLQVEFLQPDHFYDPVNATIFREIRRTLTAGRLADAVTLKNSFEQFGVLADVGGTAYLAQLLTAMVAIDVAGEYGRVVLDSWVKRQLIEVTKELAERAAFGPVDGADLARDMAARVYDLIASDRDGPSIVTLGDAAAAAIAKAEAIHAGKPSGALLCGFPPVDRAIGGFFKERLYLLGGRSRMGKTALAVQIATGVADRLLVDQRRPDAGPPGYVVVYSYEMASIELGEREISRWSNTPGEWLAKGKLTDSLCLALSNAQAGMAALPFLIVDSVGMSADQLIVHLRFLRQRYPIAMVVIDHLGKMPRARGSERVGDAMAAGQTTSRLKDAARQLKIPILALAQLGRDVDRRPDPRPVLADLLYAGEVDADVCALLWRPELYASKSEPEHNGKESEEALQKRKDAWRAKIESLAGVAEFIVAKNRGGRESLTVLEFDGDTTSFREKGRANDDQGSIADYAPFL